ncbi:methyl-accepting chemotaxis protein [Pseudomaricurvus alkylphenolicus]|uniref:methyl-accepting chemotaxis protein n=1 Tax=Pseudomaricurvus alkylphenolicus TaxID=1306991 RepID=UPI001420244C|nr:methyl-accepting chemotaxis protein [Pseudomaricurvus alkylphenolicus]NIB42224.1 methyl-accepting chemotaxis protein [Pseudomaricurvus alkylphenolicus]
MGMWLNHLTIRSKLTLVAVAAIVGMGLMVALKYNFDRRIDGLHQAGVLIREIESGMLTLRRNEKDFLARLDLKYRDKFNSNHELLMSDLQKLKERLKGQGVEIQSINNLDEVFSDYRSAFLGIVSQQQTLGMHAKDGLYGRLRQAVHQVEDIVGAQQNHLLMKDMLMLRRREKDFMLRWDMKYADKFSTDLAVFHDNLQRSSIDPESKQEITGFMENYERDFMAFVAASQHKGLSSSKGLHGKMRSTVHQSEQLLETASQELNQQLEEQRAINQSRYLLTVVGIAALILGGLYFILRSIQGPIKELTQLMQKARAEHDLSVRSNMNGRDEISVMAQVFDDMLDKFGKVLDRIYRSTGEMGVATHQLTSVSEQTNRNINEQRSQTEQVATAMNQMSATVQEVSNNISITADASEDANRETDKGRQRVEEAAIAVQSLADRIEGASEVMQQLESDSDNINAVLEVIKGVAEQTNLLALNAAIEAARAGEQGRGFAVVADEVRTLAGRTQQSAEEINQLIERLQSGSQKAVEVISISRDEARAVVEQANAAGESLVSIAEAVARINDMSVQIATASEQQSTTTDEINRNVMAIADVAQKTSLGAEQTAAANDNLNKLAGNLQGLVEEFKV